MARLTLKAFALSMFAAFFPVGPLLAEGDAFIAGIEDLPVMQGLSVLDDQGVVFDKPEGRIVEAYAHGEMAEGALLDFYGRTLPQLGWEALSTKRFAREKEILTLEIESRDGALLVAFKLSPR